MAIETKIINTVEGFLSLEKDWNELSAQSDHDGFYFSYHWFYINLTLWEDPQMKIHMICVFNDHKLIAIIPTCMKEKRLKIISLRSIKFIGNDYTPLRGAIVRRGEEHTAAKALFHLLKNSVAWDKIRFDDMPENDPFLHALVDLFQQDGVRCYLTHQYDNMVIDLSTIGQSDAYWNQLTASLRRNIKTRINKLNRDGSFEILLTSKPGPELDASILHYFNIYNKSWKIQETDQKFHVGLFKYLSEKGFLRLFTMYHYSNSGSSQEEPKPFANYQRSIEEGIPIPNNAIPIATFFFLVYGKTAYFLKTAYREDYAPYSPGSVTMWFLIKWFIDVEKISTIDFQKGNDTYKYMWASFKENHVLCKIANPRRFKPTLVLWFQYNVLSFAQVLNRKIRTVLKDRLVRKTQP